MLLILSLAIAGKIAGSLLNAQGCSQEQMLTVPYARNAELESLRQIAAQRGTHGFEPPQAA
ncbi:hypothetical protein [Acaryochloris thomasi]|uniref:hypothetical protein n=1 Tax=Acaryochloris thomasi TaxID=2929456 RepID=UPI000DA6596F|nr:hypothetical protein [Acaryochloris thomasi]